MELNVRETCDYLQNQLNMPLFFEGRGVDVQPPTSVCRQLFQIWRRLGKSPRKYEDFLDSLRFDIKGGTVWVTVVPDYAPWIGGGIASAAVLGTGAFLANRFVRKPAVEPQTLAAVGTVTDPEKQALSHPGRNTSGTPVPSTAEGSPDLDDTEKRFE